MFMKALYIFNLGWVAWGVKTITGKTIMDWTSRGEISRASMREREKLMHMKALAIQSRMGCIWSKDDYRKDDHGLDE